MNVTFRVVFFVTILLGFNLNAQQVEKLVTPYFENAYKVNDKIYRSEQPSTAGFMYLDSLGIGVSLNLRNRVSDKRFAKKTALDLKRIRINSWRMDYNDILEALKIIKNSTSPVLVHCKHGADRTGVVVASYRIAFEGWTKEKAIEEFLNEGYGYHQSWLPNLLKLLQSLDEEKLRGDILN
jgi:protein tyrosine/serine phosphatase